MTSYQEAFRRFQVAFFFRAITAHGGDYGAAARAIGVSRNTLTRALTSAGYRCARVRRIARKHQPESISAPQLSVVNEAAQERRSA